MEVHNPPDGFSAPGWRSWPWLGAACVTAATLAGCAVSSSTPCPEAVPQTSLEALEGGPDGRRWLGPEGSRARRAGAKDLLILAVDAGAAGDRISGFARIPDAECVLLLARGAASVEDLDLLAYGDNGAVLGVDEAPDATPRVLICPPHPRRLFVVARIASGHGLVALGAQTFSTAHAADVARALGIQPSQQLGLESWQGLETVLANHRKRIGGRWLDIRRLALPLDPRAAAHVTTQIAEEGCVDILVIPSPQVSHLDVAAINAEGRVLGRASAMDRLRSMIVCSSVAAPVTVAIRPHAGQGTAAVLMSRSRAGSGPEADIHGLVFEATPLADLEAEHTNMVEELERLGYPRRPKWSRRAKLSAGHRFSHPFTAAAGCHRLDVVAGRPVSGLEAWLWSSDGELIAADRGTGHLALWACTHGTQARLDVEAVGASGDHIVELRSEERVPELVLDHPLAASRLLAGLRSRGMVQRDSDLGTAEVVSLSPNALERREISALAGRCLDVTLALGPGATGAEIRVVDRATGQELDLARGTQSANSTTCALSTSRTLQADLELRAAAGEADALLATRPLAPDP